MGEALKTCTSVTFSELRATVPWGKIAPSKGPRRIEEPWMPGRMGALTLSVTVMVFWAPGAGVLWPILISSMAGFLM